MKLSKSEFFDQPEKSISLIGMSGVGKSHTASQLEKWGWFNYSCDYLIATKYLADKVEGAVSADDIVNLSEFVGQVGDEARGGVGLEEFQRRQNMYYDAEVAVLSDLSDAFDQARADGFTKLINDSSGSLCEVRDASVLEAVGQKTLFVYLEVDPKDHASILGRAIAYPKPLYFPPDFFMQRLNEFQEEYGLGGVEEIDPLRFLSWVFPHLFTTRLPKYERLSHKYGVTISAKEFRTLKDENEFLQIIGDALDE
ncbi:MAG: hypothetical protein KDJ35_07005 [Alphaproteobacteria bacterium]|nr:hypothetical protein [Alphaproteobacteria bacterium]